MDSCVCMCGWGGKRESVIVIRDSNQSIFGVLESWQLYKKMRRYQ